MESMNRPVHRHGGVAKPSASALPSEVTGGFHDMNRISAKTLHGWIIDGQELALLDARGDGEFGTSHLFWAVPCGLARKEIRARALLTRLTVRICCVDDGRGIAEELAGWLESIGCSDVSVFDGGT